MPIKDESFGEFGDQVLEAIADGVEYQGEAIPPKSNLKPFKDRQTPTDVIKKRINAEIKEMQIVAGLTVTQRKILKAKIEAMRTRVYNDDKNYTTDASIAKALKIRPETITLFNHNEICRNALMMCSKIYVETVMPDLMANLMVQAKDSWQPNIKLLEIIQQYAKRTQAENINKNLNINLEMGNSPEAIKRQIAIKFGSVGYDRKRFQEEIIEGLMETYDLLKAEGAF